MFQKNFQENHLCNLWPKQGLEKNVSYDFGLKNIQENTPG